MRIWSLHPKYLDSRGLVALWREALLARKVLANNTKGYRNHPQLNRFKEQPDPPGAINYYLTAVYKEAISRGYNFDSNKIPENLSAFSMQVTTGQIQYEYRHLLSKLKIRDIVKYKVLYNTLNPDLHPLFSEIPGGIEDWEKPVPEKV